MNITSQHYLPLFVGIVNHMLLAVLPKYECVLKLKRHITSDILTDEPHRTNRLFFVHLFRIQLKSMSNMWNTILNAFVYCNQCIFCHECNWRHSIHWSTQIRHKIQREPNIYFGSR